MADYKVVDTEVLDAELNALADSIRKKSGISGDLAFPNPNEFKEAVDSITAVINGTKPETITSNGNHPTGGYSDVEVNVPPPEGYIKPSGNSPTITTNGTHPVRQYENAVVNVTVPDEYVQKSLLRSGIHYFDLNSNKTGVSNVNSSWYSFTPAFVPKFILFAQSENANGTVTRISSSIDTVVMSFWFDGTIFDYTRYYAKGGFLRKDGTPAFNISSNGTGARYDVNTNKIYFYCAASAYGLKAGTNSQSTSSGFYVIQYWG